MDFQQKEKLNSLLSLKIRLRLRKVNRTQLNFFVISKQPVSEEFVEIFRDNAINYVDPRHVGDFKDLFGDAALMVDE